LAACGSTVSWSRKIGLALSTLFGAAALVGVPSMIEIVSVHHHCSLAGSGSGTPPTTRTRTSPYGANPWLFAAYTATAW
jgi:hypothetical protein